MATGSRTRWRLVAVNGLRGIPRLARPRGNVGHHIAYFPNVDLGHDGVVLDIRIINGVETSVQGRWSAPGEELPERISHRREIIGRQREVAILDRHQRGGGGLIAGRTATATPPPPREERIGTRRTGRPGPRSLDPRSRFQLHPTARRGLGTNEWGQSETKWRLQRQSSF